MLNKKNYVKHFSYTRTFIQVYAVTRNPIIFLVNENKLGSWVLLNGFLALELTLQRLI